MSPELILTVFVQLATFAFLYGRQTEAIKGLRERDEKHEANDEKLTDAINKLSGVVDRHIGEHEGARK